MSERAGAPALSSLISKLTRAKGEKIMFSIGQPVRFSDSSFLRRQIGYLAWVQKAVTEKRTFVVRDTQRGFIVLGDSSDKDWHSEWLNVDLFEAA